MDQRAYYAGFPVKRLISEALNREKLYLLDCHVHIDNTHRHYPHTGSIDTYVEEALKKGVSFVQTEHNLIPAHASDYWLENFGIDVLPGIELSTADGHFSCLFMAQSQYDVLLSYSSPRCSIDETLELINKVGGKQRLHVLPHTFQLGGLLETFSHNGDEERIDQFLPKDKSEMFFYELTNCNNGVDAENARKVIELIRQKLYNITNIGGSDAHSPKMLGVCGNIFFAPWENMSHLSKKFKKRRHRVYDIKFNRMSSSRKYVCGILNIVDATASHIDKYSFRYYHHEKKIEVLRKCPV